MAMLEPPQGPYREQVERLEHATIDERFEFEELAAHYEFNCGEQRLHAERSAYCHIQWVKGWGRKSFYPDFSKATHDNE